MWRRRGVVEFAHIRHAGVVKPAVIVCCHEALVCMKCERVRVHGGRGCDDGSSVGASAESFIS